MSLVRNHSRMLLQNRSLWDEYGKDGWHVFGRHREFFGLSGAHHATYARGKMRRCAHRS